MCVIKEGLSFLDLYYILIELAARTSLAALLGEPAFWFCSLLQNMKQKITIEANIWCDKCRSKAMKIAAVEDGVKSVAFKGARRDQIELIGDDVDATGLTGLLRKKLGYAELVSLEEITEKKVDKEEKKTSQDEQNTNSYSPIREEDVVITMSWNCTSMIHHQGLHYYVTI